MTDGTIAMDPVILMAAPNGARRTKKDHPALPMTPDEIAVAAAACLDAGAVLLHLHVRDRNGVHTLDPDAYRAATEAIRRAVGDRMIVQVTTEAVGMFSPAEQIASVRAVRPEAVSVAICELAATADQEADAAAFFAWLHGEGVMTQYILYSVDDIRRFTDLRRRGLIPEDRPSVIYPLGRYTAGQVSAPADLLPFLAAKEADNDNSVWTVCAFGPREGACAVAAAALGGHVRVGFENNLRLGDGSIAPDNAALLAQARAGIELIGLRAAAVDEARAQFAPS